MSDLSSSASEVVDRILERGLAEGHRPDSWRTEPATFHALKAARHIQSAMLEMLHADSGLPLRADGTAEEHLERALCRVAMALWVHRRETSGVEEVFSELDSKIF